MYLLLQVAANFRGIQLVGELIEEYGLPVVHAYMRYIQENAEQAVRDMLREFSDKQGLPEVDICLRVRTVHLQRSCTYA